MAKKEIPKIKVEPRQRMGSRYSARLRDGGRLPAVIYGHGQDPAHVSIDTIEMDQLLHKNTHIVEAVLDSKGEPCLIKDVQWDHLGSQLVHIDLARIDLTERVRVEVRIELTGEAVGLKEAGAILEQPVTKIEVECLATEIPDSIRADVTEMKVDDVLMVGQLKLPEGVTTTVDPETIVASVSIVAEEVIEAAAPAEGEAAEPEVIGKKVEEGAEGEGAEAGAEAKAGAKPAAKPAAAGKETGKKG